MEVIQCLVLVISLAVSNGQWMTEYDQHFKLECPDNQGIKALDSEHDNHHEDRVWNMYCAVPPNNVTLSSCEWSGYVNNYDELFEYQCTGERIITGFEAIHDNSREDRMFSFKCCNADNALAHGCEFTPYVNEYDKMLNYRVPDGYIIKGINSVNDNSHEDRMFKFNICKLDHVEVIVG